ncbi:MAG: preprotein translocase subunit YajC [Phascolarctobacterium sp.]|nr:preprotein translocase subunit YajC [Phascolarctobacterium sp.]
MSDEQMSILNLLWPFILMAGIFYFILWKPQKKEQQKRKNLLGALKKGDKIITIGGVYGTITALSEEKMTLEIAEGVEIDFLRSAVSGFQDPERNKAIG